MSWGRLQNRPSATVCQRGPQPRIRQQVRILKQLICYAALASRSTLKHLFKGLSRRRQTRDGTISVGYVRLGLRQKYLTELCAENLLYFSIVCERFYGQQSIRAGADPRRSSRRPVL